MLTSADTKEEVQSAEISQTTMEEVDNNGQAQQEDQAVQENNQDGQDQDMDTVKKKRNRSRKKKLYSEICKQMEFYFSDANISKNRTMESLITKGNGYVDLNEFVNFHKIQKMTQGMDLIQMLQKALKHSEILELSEDLTKVKRKVPYDRKNLKSESELEACTIYVENIPLHFDQDKLKELFQEFGPISYVAIPKSRQSGLHKGFAFVEFENSESARCCLKAYGDIGLCLPDTMDPGDLQSVKTFDRNESSIGDTETLSAKIDNYSLTAQKNKRKHVSSKDANNKDNEQNQKDNDAIVEQEEEQDDEIPKKKIKVEKSEEQQQEILKEKDENNSNEKSSNSGQQQQSLIVTEVVQNNNSNEDNDKLSTKKKKRRRNQKTKKIEDIEKCESESIQLRIMPKMSWRQLRNRYLNLQRKNLSDLKKLYRHQKQQQEGEMDHEDVLEPYKSGPKKKNKKKEITLVKPSVLVKIGFSTPPKESESDLKEKLSNLLPQQWSNAVQYIDLAMLPSHIIVKLNGNDDCIEAVSDFVQNAIPIYNEVEILSADAAEEYWQTVRKNLKQKSTRGRDKIMQQAMKANTHIRFDDSNSPESNKKEEEGV